MAELAALHPCDKHAPRAGSKGQCRTAGVLGVTHADEGRQAATDLDAILFCAAMAALAPRRLSDLDAVLRLAAVASLAPRGPGEIGGHVSCSPCWIGHFIPS